MGKVKKISKFYSLFLPAFLLPVIFAAIAYFLNDIYPGSAFTILVFDEASQYSAIWESIRYIFNSDNSLLFNWSLCYGGDNISLLAYYLGNISNAVMALFPVSLLPTVLYFVTILKFGFAGLSFSVFAYIIFKDRLKNIFLLTFSLAYALMAYNVTYSMCIMWLDGVILLPLLILSIERILKGHKNIFFVVILTASIYTDYYIAYMMVLFAVIYLVYRLVIIKPYIKDLRKIIGKFVLGGFISGVLSSPLLYFVVSDLLRGKFKEGDSGIVAGNTEFLSVLKKLLPLSFDTMDTVGSPNIFAGSFMLIFIIIYFASKRETVRARMATFVVFVIFFCSFIFRTIDDMWHGFRSPICFPGRYSFVFSFFMIIIAMRGLIDLQEWVMQGSSMRLYVRKYVFPLFVGYTLIELLLNATYTINEIHIEREYRRADKFERIISEMKEATDYIKLSDDGFYRTDSGVTFGYNDPMFFGVNGVASFSSTYNYNVLSNLKKLGVSQHDYIIEGNGMNPFLRDVLSVKYYCSDKDDPKIYDHSIIDAGCKLNIFRNDSVLPIGFAVSGLADAEFSSDNVFVNNNMFCKALTGLDDLFVPVDVTVSDSPKDEYEYSKIITFKASNSNPLYLFCKGETQYETTMRIRELSKKYKENEYGIPGVKNEAMYFVNGECIGDNNVPFGQYMESLGCFNEGEEIVVEIDSTYPLNDIWISFMDCNVYDEAVSKLKENVINVTYHANGEICGTIHADSDSTLFTSIPYSSHFTVYVNGNRVKKDSILNTFLTVPLMQGDNTVTIKYGIWGLD